jgi:hypothetical protein
MTTIMRMDAPPTLRPTTRPMLALAGSGDAVGLLTIVGTGEGVAGSDRDGDVVVTGDAADVTNGETDVTIVGDGHDVTGSEGEIEGAVDAVIAGDMLGDSDDVAGSEGGVDGAVYVVIVGDSEDANDGKAVID